MKIPVSPSQPPLASRRLVRAALAGNPNTGKTTLFNALTGLNHKVGNYPGVTVERKTGRFLHEGLEVELLDLPGTYSLAARSPDEMVVVDVLLGQQKGEDPIDGIIAIVDASNLTRNFYLVSQLLELGLPMVIALTMNDLAEAKGIQIDAAGLSQRLGVPVVPLSAHRRKGLDQLKRALHETLAKPVQAPYETPIFPENLRLALYQLKQGIPARGGQNLPVPDIKLFRALIDSGGYTEKQLIVQLGRAFGDCLATARQAAGGTLPLSAIETKIRYEWISSLLNPYVKRPKALIPTRSDQIDKVLTHRFFGTVIFLGLMAFVFQAIYAGASPLMDLIDGFFVWLGSGASRILPEGALRSLVVDGVISGVGAVLVFLPQITILFFFIAILEDCGYMPRAAYLMDRLLSKCGLSGKSFIPLLSSFACAVPGIMATRTIEDRRDRITTMLVAPLMSCSARLPVYLIFIAAMIPDRAVLGGWVGLQGLTLFSLYLAGIIVAVPMAWLIKYVFFKNETAPFVMELPSYKWPTPRTVALFVFDSAVEFVRRAGTIIFCVAILVWAVAYFPHPATIGEHYGQLRRETWETFARDLLPLLQSLDPQRYGPDLNAERLQAALAEEIRLREEESVPPEWLPVRDRLDAYQKTVTQLNNQEAGEYLRNSWLGRMGRIIAPVVEPLGWDWRIGMATLASFPAREIIVAVLGTIFNLGADTDENSLSLREAIRQAQREDGRPLFSIAVALSIMVFFALCSQCVATLAAIKRESNSYRWPLFTFTYLTLLAYMGAWITYQLGVRLGLG
ncbi:MAG TPA: ferrous iron transport protein B [bacterium]|nr:ferrous iron transport protein B [bacterium]